MPVIELQRVPGTPKERIAVPAGTALADWLLAADIHADVMVVVNGREIGPDEDVGFLLTDADRVQVFDQPKGVLAVVKPLFKLISKVLSFLVPKPSVSVADSNGKESPNNKLTGQTNVARTYQARPDVYGEVRSFPDLIQQSCYEYINDKKYITEVMNFGIGRYDVSSVRYSETNLGSLAGATYSIYNPGEVIGQLIEPYLFDGIDGQEVPGKNESESTPVESATTNTVISGEYSGGQIAVSIPKNTEFDYFLGLSFPHAVSFTLNVTYNTASGVVTKDVGLSGNLIGAVETNDGAVPPADYRYTFTITDITGDVTQYLTTATINNSRFTLVDKATLVVGPFVSPITSTAIWVHTVSDLGPVDGTTDFVIKCWAVDENNNQIPGTLQTVSDSIDNPFNVTTKSYYRTYKFTPAYGLAKYAVSIERTNNSNSGNKLTLDGVHAINVRNGVVYPNDTLVKVTIRATERPTNIHERKYNALITRHTISYNRSTRQVDYTLRPSRSFADAVAHTWLVMGRQDVTSIDLQALYDIAAGLSDPRLGYFDYTFDDEDVSLGSRVASICGAARVTAFSEDGVLSFVRNQAVPYPATTFNRANMTSDGYRLTYEMTMPGGYDGVEIEYVSPTTNKKTYIRLRITATGIVEQAAESPLKVTIVGCRNEFQARDRAFMEARRLIYSRGKMTCTTLADGQYVSVGDMVQVPDTFDTNQQSGYIVKRTGNDFDTSEAIAFAGAMFVTVTDDLGSTSARYPATARADTRFGFTAALPAIALNIWDGYDVQSPSRYVIATQEEMDGTLWLVDDKKPNSDGTTAFTLSEYNDSIYS